jgi:ABC-type sugar transport system substrate-binding protein
MTKFTYLNRRHFMATTAATSLLLGASHTSAAEPIKVAAIYTVPVEQQWVSRIHKAAQTAQNRNAITYTFLRERKQYRLCSCDA